MPRTGFRCGNLFQVPLGIPSRFRQIVSAHFGSGPSPRTADHEGCEIGISQFDDFVLLVSYHVRAFISGCVSENRLRTVPGLHQRSAGRDPAGNDIDRRMRKRLLVQKQGKFSEQLPENPECVKSRCGAGKPDKIPEASPRRIRHLSGFPYHPERLFRPAGKRFAASRFPLSADQCPGGRG